MAPSRFLSAPPLRPLGYLLGQPAAYQINTDTTSRTRDCLLPINCSTFGARLPSVTPR